MLTHTRALRCQYLHFCTSQARKRRTSPRRRGRGRHSEDATQFVSICTFVLVKHDAAVYLRPLPVYLLAEDATQFTCFTSTPQFTCVLY